jgi:hypothetical protein
LVKLIGMEVDLEEKIDEFEGSFGDKNIFV